MSPLARLWTALICLAVVAGCASVPTTGPVEQVSAEPGRINPGVEIAPAPPAEDASRADVVEGFLHAMASWQPDYRVARTYLTPAADTDWDPASGVRIFAEGNAVAVTQTGAHLSAPLVGALDSAGTYRQSTGTLDHDFGLVEDESGQWRISRPPPGIIISEYLFSSAFDQVEVYFTAAGGDWLVPDTRYFPRGGVALADAVSAVVHQEAGWLSPGVDLSFRLEGPVSTTVDADGVATVALAGGGEDLPEEARVALTSRLVWTLRQFSHVTGVRVGWEEEPWWTIPGYGQTVPLSAFAEVNPADPSTSRQLYGIVSGRLARLVEGSGGVETIASADGIEGADYAAVRPDALQAAAVTEGRTRLVEGPMAQPGSTTVATAIAFRRPQYSRQGELWVVDDRGQLTLVAPGEDPQPVEVDLLGDRKIVAFRLSPDGARAALIVEEPGGSTEVGVAVVARSGGTARLEGLHTLSVSDSAVSHRSVIDLGWRTPGGLLVLVSDGVSDTVISLPQDGSVLTPIGPIADARLVELAVAPGVPAWLRTADGQLVRYVADFRWSTQEASVASIFYPG
ncbi:MAG: LpqB family beta-propeller domain-containing protein [Propioniciclava sp.]